MERTQSLKGTKIDKARIISLEKGKLPPQALELEEAVLGAMMIDKKGIDEVIDILHPDAFYDKRHQEIYAAIYELFQNSEPIDLLSVSNQLKKNGKLDLAGGDFYLIGLTQKVASSAHIEFHSRIILEKFIQRKLITISSEIIENAYDETVDVFDLLDDAEGKLFEVTQGNLKKGAERADSLVQQSINKIQEISTKEGMSGLATGFTKLDALTSGWQPTDLIIIAARPGMGKTAFVISMAKNMAIDFGHPVALFSLEMSSVQLITRMISSETGLTSEKLRKGNLEPHEWEQLNVKVKKLSDAPIFIDDTPALSIFDLRAKARRLVSQHGVKILIIDYLQLMTAGGAGGNREQEISTISRNLKALGKELNVPVIALSQLSRAVETRGGSKRPLLSDLRESGAIEQDADIVSFIYRPEYYGMTEWDDDDHSPCEGQGEFIVAKHRNGGLDNIRLKFTGHLAKFSDLEEGFSSEFQSSMNSGFNDEVASSNFASPEDAFGPSDDDVPF
ncbi:MULTISPECIES: replicative DNA helicase [Tenacibaculum]|uniref:Replicative DNA helicase n=5 Tax=Tenacibaculum TaxID=104267 RepID=A0A2G1BX68_9FLAO|nr:MULTISPECIES: replicative DNA helicase [Tenacibaculum]AZJ31752.1 replicative DNA helicase [Tenacibaculum mesophilum]AZJ35898.1 replicative DNA helicase [Tenacibaculum singaporense]KAF9657858.1 replicative DNA helicase [Tenacibaculum mesophilum]MCG7502247.1 replicative DNA helicase [Tenacibaculum sp. Mcav3-52]MDE1206635.1 replicative DNA helicase [Tenacibaculum larymnensis]|eukprot:TRINITY_DN7574_c0_g1_i4.p1 TRINITY_DN7574_c0_g1~~TRINITY_DN7574_c0_g1_i4.p1  ORF type:complete len:505 (+),score=110.90 TRINITY_DN7574_c0_g1_i4:394-1908(+)